MRVRSAPPGGPSSKDLICLNRIPFPPPPQPGASYDVVGLGQRCLEGQLLPVSGRRGRELAGAPDVQACYVRCAAEGLSVPFHFSVASDGAGCWCCGATCTLIRDSSVTVGVMHGLGGRGARVRVDGESSLINFRTHTPWTTTVLRRDGPARDAVPHLLSIGLPDATAHDQGADQAPHDGSDNVTDHCAHQGPDIGVGWRCSPWPTMHHL